MEEFIKMLDLNLLSSRSEAKLNSTLSFYLFSPGKHTLAFLNM